MTLLAPSTLSVEGSTPTFAAASAGGDTVPVGRGTFAVIRNGSATAITATVTTPVMVGGAVQYSVSVAAGADAWVALPERSQALHAGQPIVQGTQADALIECSATASVSIAAVRAG